MKPALYVLIVFLIACSCSQSSTSDKMIVNGKIKGLKKGKLYLQKEGDSGLVSVDSATIDGNEAFTLKTTSEEPEIHYLHLILNTGEPINERFGFFGQPGTLQIESSLKKFGNEVKISGSVNQEKLENYRKLVKRFVDGNLDLIRQQLVAGQSGNDSLLAVKRAEQKRLLASKYLATVNFALNERDFAVAPYLMVTEVYDANLKYLDTVYKVLPEKIRQSIYGNQLKELIETRRGDSN